MKAETNSSGALRVPRRRLTPLRRSEFAWGVLWEGTPHQLLMAGCARQEQIDAALHRGGRRGPTPLVPGPLGRQIQVRRSSRNRLSVSEHWRPEEARAWSARQEAQEALRRLPQSAESFLREKREAAAWKLFQCLEGLRSGEGGYSIDAGSMSAVEEIVAEAAAALDGLTVTFDRADRARVEARILDGAARADVGFLRFLDDVAAGSDAGSVAPE